MDDERHFFHSAQGSAIERGTPIGLLRWTSRRTTDVCKEMRYGAVLLTVLGAGLTACGSSTGTQADGPGSRFVALPGRATVVLPTGWHLLRKPIDGVIEPASVLAAATFPVDSHTPSPGGCTPSHVLDQMPAGGALVEVVELTLGAGGATHPNLAKYPARPVPFRLTAHDYGTYECNGPSYNVSFRASGRAFQAFVWLDPRRVDPRTRAQAVGLLSSLRFARPD